MAEEYAFKQDILGNDEQLKRNMSEVIVSTIEKVRTENVASLVVMTATDTDKTELVAVNSQPSKNYRITHSNCKYSSILYFHVHNCHSH